MENIKIKKRQFVVIQFKEENLKIENNEVIAKINKENYVQTSATSLLRQLEKIEKKNNINRSIEDFNKEMKELGIREFNVNSYIKLVSIEFGQATKGNAELIEKCITEGFKIKNTKMKFIGTVGGSHVKNVKQFYVREDIHEEVEKKINLKELKHCIIPKRLTSNALLTTSIWEIPYKLDMLNICILPDNEIEKAFPNKLETLVPYTYNEFTDEEKAKYDDFKEYENLSQKLHEFTTAKKVDYSKVLCVNNWDSYKTIKQWVENGRLVMSEEVKNILYYNKVQDGSKIPVYKQNQTIELKHNIFEVAEWSLGYKVVDYNEKLSVNNFDGFGLCSLELGEYIRSYMNDYYINGFQLRIPQQKGFYNIVDFKSYCREHGIEYLYDMFGYKWLVEDIDIITTESTFKAKIETDETGLSKKWMWNSYQEYQSTIVSQGHDCIGIANYTHVRHPDEYRTLTYQLLEALNATEFDLLSLANEHGKMLYKVISIYRENREKGAEINWEDIKYIKCYLQSLLEEKGAEEDDYVVTALKCIDLNKNMIFDKKFTTFLSREIERELNQLSLGQIKVKSNYLYITTDILGFLKYASQFGTEEAKDANHRKELSCKEVEGILQEGQFYCEGVIGKKLMVRNPLMAQSEVIKAEYIDLSKVQDYKYIKHLNNILQAPMNTYHFQQATFDIDGDKFHLIHLDHNLKNYNLDWLVNYDFIPEVKESLDKKEEDLKTELTNLDILKQKMDLYYSTRFKDQAIVTLADLISDDHKIIVNPSDGKTVEGQEWNTKNIHQFLVDSDDKTGIITDFNTIALNQFNSIELQDYFDYWFESIYKNNNVEEKFQDYKCTGLSEEELEIKKAQLKLTNKYCKFFQGIIIDMSKRGGVVEIAKILKLVYKKQPQFYEMKGKNKNDLDKDVKSHMDRFYKKMQSLNRTAGKLFSSKVRENISNHELYFTPKLIQNAKINHTEYLNKIKELLKPLIKNYQEEMQKLVDEKKNINKFSKDDEHKNARLESKKKFKELAIKTEEEAKKHCPNDLVLAQCLYSHIYQDESKAFSYAWVVAEKGFIYNLQSNQTEKYNIELAIASSDTDIFEYFGKKYKLTVTDNQIEYYKREDLMLNKLDKFMLDTDVERVEDAKLKFIANAPHYKEDKENYVENLLQDITEKEFVLKEENGFVQLADLEGNILIGINSKELDYSEIDIPNRNGYKIKFKEIERTINKDKKLNKTGFEAIVDIYK